MKGVYFINENALLNGLTMEDSISLQKEVIEQYVSKHNIHIVKLNPYQLKDYYTILHALLYDLKKANQQLDCFIHYSPKVLDDFIYTYPAKWLILKSFFKEIIVVEEQNDLNFRKVI